MTNRTLEPVFLTEGSWAVEEAKGGGGLVNGGVRQILSPNYSIGYHVWVERCQKVGFANSTWWSMQNLLI